ncbi:MAG: glycosyltransferase family 39 protein [Candidatus Paceibacterota bacterium]
MPNITPFLSRHKYIVALLAFAAVNVLVSCFYIGYSREFVGDAITYRDAANFLQGGQSVGAVPMNRVLTTPLFLYLSIFFNSFLHNFALSTSLLNIIFYFGCVLGFYFLAREIYGARAGFLASILFSFNYYVMEPSNARLADMGGWLFFILATYFAVKYINSSDKKHYFWSIAMSAVGVLFKEYGGLGLINLILLILVSDWQNKRKIKDIFLAGLVFFAVLASYHAFVFLKYHYTYLDWYVFVHNASAVPGFQAKGFAVLIKVLGWLFTFGWLAFLLGLKEEFVARDFKRIKILLALLPITLTFYIWPAIAQRLAVIFMMWLALIAGFGLSRVKWYLLYPFLGVYIWFNWNIKFLIEKINLPF